MKKSPFTTEQFEDFAVNLSTDWLDELTRKNKDYAREGRALGDVYTIAEDCEMTPAQVAFVHMSKHWTAIKNRVFKQKTHSEPVAGRLRDLSNYALILAVILDSETEPMPEEVLGTTKDLEVKVLSKNVHYVYDKDLKHPFYPREDTHVLCGICGLSRSAKRHANQGVLAKDGTITGHGSSN